MTPGDSRLYADLVDRILYLGSTDAIQRAVSSMKGLDPLVLGRELDERSEQLQKEGRETDIELLAFVRDALKNILRRPDPVQDRDVHTFGDLQRVAGSVDALRMRTLLQLHREMLTADHMLKLELSAIEADLAPEVKLRRITLAYVAALMTGKRERRARACLLAGGFWLGERQTGRAERLLKRAIRLSPDGDYSLKGQILGAQAGLYRVAGDLPKAIEIMEECLDLYSGVNDFPMLAITRTGLARACQKLGRYPRAADEINAAVSLIEQHGLTNLANTLILRGLILENLGRYEQGARDYSRAATLAGEDNDRGVEFIANTSLALSYLKRELPREACRRLREVLTTVERWGNPIMIASTHNNLGTALLQIGRPAEALGDFFQALLGKAAVSGNEEGEAMAYFNIGDALLALGEIQDAKIFYGMALGPILRCAEPKMMFMWALHMTDRRVRSVEEDPIAILEGARQQAIEGSFRFHELVIVNRLAECQLERGNEAEALRLYEEVFQQGPLDPRASEQVLLITGYARLLAKQPNGAQRAFQILDSARGMIDNEIRGVLVDERRAEAIARSIDLYDALIELLSGGNPALNTGARSPAMLAFDLHESAKARTLLSTLADSPLIPPDSVPKELREREAELLQAERGFQDGELGESNVYQEQRLREIRTGLEACWRDMRPFAPDYVRFRSGAPCRFEEIQAALAREGGGDTAFVSFFCGASGTTIFVVRPDRAEPLIFRSPTGTAEWRAAALRLRRVFNGAPAEFPPYPPILRDRPWQRSLEFLDKAAGNMLEFLSELGGFRYLCVAPHGPLHLIPLHALRIADGEFVARRFGVAYCPSLSIAVQKFSRSCEPPSKLSVFVAGTSAKGDLHPEYFERDAAIFDPAQWSVESGFGVKGCSQQSVLAALPLHDVIHLSCHGYFDTVHTFDSGLLVSNGEEKPPRDLQSMSVAERRYYLVTVRDLLRTRLKARLVTFDACSGGLQAEKNAGDELEGFNRALLLAGANSVVLGLWNVDQQSSADFLDRFYRYWLNDQEPEAKLRALHRAQMDFLDAPERYLNHPYHWAPFTLSGDWR